MYLYVTLYIERDVLFWFVSYRCCTMLPKSASRGQPKNETILLLVDSVKAYCH